MLPAGLLSEATRIAHAVAEVTNFPPASRQPYVGTSAFAHKAGLHASAIKVDPNLYQHLDPVAVGNDMRLLVSDMAGRASIELKGRELGLRPGPTTRTLITRITDRVKELESRGYTFEAADASFELLLVEEVEGAAPVVLRRRVVAGDHRDAPHAGDGEAVSEATVKLRAGGARIVVTGEGNGPVNALDHALREAIGQAYPEVAKFELIDYKVRILDQGHGTDAITRVLIETSDGALVVGDRRRRAQRDRGVVGGAGRRADLRAAPPRPVVSAAMTPDDVYTHGHAESVLRSHRWRTAENSAGLPRCRTCATDARPPRRRLRAGHDHRRPRPRACAPGRVRRPRPVRRRRRRGARRGRAAAGVAERRVRASATSTPSTHARRHASTSCTPTRCSST